MKHASAFFPFLLLWGASAFAQSEKWTALFNGRTLAGWTQKGGRAQYSIRRGVLTGTAVPDSPNSFLCTDSVYGDFILELELAVDDGLNSGIQIRSQAKPGVNDGRVFGWQVEVDPSPRAWSGGIYEEGRRDWLYIPNFNPEGKNAFRSGGRWNRYRIEAIGNTIRTWINDVPVACFVDTLVERGFIALQVHAIGKPEEAGKQVRWRNIRIQTGRHMRPRPWDRCPVLNLTLNQLCGQEKAQGWQLLFNGADLAGWQTASGTDTSAGSWRVAGGVLTLPDAADATANRSLDLRSRESFDAFELNFEFRLGEGANSGVKYFVQEYTDSTGSRVAGLEYQLLDDERHPDARRGTDGNRTLASLYDLIPSRKPEARFQRPIGAWNQGRIVARADGSVEHWLNGFKVLEYVRGSDVFAALVARSKFSGLKDFGMAGSGPILLQDHGDAVWFRNIKIRRLR